MAPLGQAILEAARFQATGLGAIALVTAEAETDVAAASGAQ